MAKKATPSPASKKPSGSSVGTPAAKTPTGSAAADPAGMPKATSPVRNSPVPKAQPSPAATPAGGAQQGKSITHDMIAQRAYDIHSSGRGGSDFENWVRAEHELRQEMGL